MATTFVPGVSLLLAPSNVEALETDYKTPSSYNWSIGLRRELGWGTSMDATYAGSVGRNLEMYYNLNAVPDGARFLDRTRPPRSRQHQPDRGPARRLPAAVLRLRSIRVRGNSGTSDYNALQVQVNRRYIHGVQFGGAYTLQRARGLADEDPGNLSITLNRPQDVLLRRAGAEQPALAGRSTTRGTSRRTASRNAVLHQALDGWQLSGENAFVSGRLGAGHPDDQRQLRLHRRRRRHRRRPRRRLPHRPCRCMTCDPMAHTGSPLTGWFDTSCFARPSGRGDYGDAPRNAVRKPGHQQLEPGAVQELPDRRPPQRSSTGSRPTTCSTRAVPGRRSHRALRRDRCADQRQLRHRDRHREPDASAARRADVAAVQLLGRQPRQEARQNGLTLICGLVPFAVCLRWLVGVSRDWRGADPPRRGRPDPAREKRLEWFREAKYGMFIHWGLYAIPAGDWHGQRCARARRVDDEPLAGAGRRTTSSSPTQFNPVKFDPDEWVQLAQDAGMKYIVITVEAPRRLRDVQVGGQHVQRRRRDAVQEGHPQAARRRVRAARHAPRLLLLAVAGLARAGRRRQHLGLRSGHRARRQDRAEEIRRLPARQGRAAGQGAPDRLRAGRAHLVRHAAHDDARARPALRRHRPLRRSRTR